MERIRPREQSQPRSSSPDRKPADSRRPRTHTYNYVRPALYKEQSDAIFYPKDKLGAHARWSWVEASTKSGKTVGCIAWLYEMALVHGKPGRNFWWVAPVYGQAKIAFRRLKLFLPKDQFESNEQDQTVTLPNGAIIWFKSGDKPDSLYGEDVWAAVIDEASRCKEEVYHAVRSTLTATRGPARFIGNVKGRRNWFYKGARKAEAGLPGHSFHKITAAQAVAAGVLAKEEIEGAEGDLPAAVFKELYYAEASDDQGNPFGYDAIKAIVKPLSKLPVQVWGADLAKKRDWTVLIGLDKNGDIAHFERFQKSWEETTNILIQRIGLYPALIDATGVGDPIVERIQKQCPDAEGYIFSQQSKQRLMEGLAVAIQRRETSALEGIHEQELESFEYEYTRTGVRYTAPEGFTDDCVYAHGLAVSIKGKEVDLSEWEKLVG